MSNGKLVLTPFEKALGTLEAVALPNSFDEFSRVVGDHRIAARGAKYHP